MSDYVCDIMRLLGLTWIFICVWYPVAIMSNRYSPIAIAIALIYALFASLWILFSDNIVSRIFITPAQIALASMIKGCLFVAVTSGLLFLLLKNWRDESTDQNIGLDVKNEAHSTRRLSLVFIALALVVPLIGFAFYKLQSIQIELETYSNLQSVAQLKAQQIESWLTEQRGDAELLLASADFNVQFQKIAQGKANRDDTSEVLKLFQALIDSEGYHSVMLIDLQGKLLASRGDELDVYQNGRDLAVLAIRRKQIQHGPLFRDSVGRVHMDWAIPVFSPSLQGEQAVATILLRVAANQFLFPLIQQWPTVSASAETLLVHREGDLVVFLNELRHRHNTALVLKLSVSEKKRPPIVAVNSTKPGNLLSRDYRGVEVFAAYRPIAGTDWRIIAKVDRNEVLAPLWNSLYWIGLIAFFAISAIIMALLLLWRQQQKTQRVAMLALKNKDDQMFVSLIDGSSDAIYIKDLEGRYLRVNRQASLIVGKTVEQIIGYDDSAIFPQEQVEIIRANDRRIIAENHTSTYEETLTTALGMRTYSATKGPMRDANGQVIGLFGISHDITHRKLEEDALKLSEERLHLVLRGSRDAPWDWNLESSDLYYSPRWWMMLGYEDNELPTGASLWEHIVHPDDRLRVNQSFDQVIKTDSESYEIEFRLQHKDGHYVPVLSRGFILRDASGRPVRVSGTNADLTERKQAEAKIQQLSQLYAAISRCSQAIVHCRNKEELFQQVCQDVVLFGGLKMAWIGLVDESSGQVIPVASHGDESGYLVDINITVDAASAFGRGPTGIAIRENQPVWIQDFVNDARTEPWKERAKKSDWAGSASLPLCCKDLAVGTFTLYTKEVNAFDNEVRSLLITMATDISFALDNFAYEIERKQAEVKLHLAANVFTYAREGILITAADGTIIEVNDAFSRITGYKRDEAIGHNPRILSSGQHKREFYVSVWGDLIEKGYWYGEIWNRHKNGNVYAVMQTISAVRDAQGNIQQYVALFSDITKLKEHESQLEHIAHFDQLTSLPNRVLLADRLRQGMTQAQRRDQKLAVVFLDLDAFKIINDTHGHAVGDQLLMTVANRMKLALREGDTLARIGGDEFVAVLLDLDDTSASEVMFKRLITAAAEPVQIDHLVLQVTASLGVTFYPQIDEVDADQLLRQADQAMYQAKQEGKNRYQIFDAEQDRNVRGHNEDIDRIRSALNDNEFVLYYQPKVNMRNGVIVGAEALIRWQHPEKGLLPPVVFLPLIEAHPLAIEVGEWVIDTALTQIGLWQADGLNIPVSVNIGALQLQQDNFVQSLKSALDAHPHVNAGNLELEILETSALQDVTQVSKVIKTCQELGVNFALDDFGTGYSSLTYLKQLPVTILKIDQTFVRDMLDDPDDLAILEGVIGLANAFGREVIAEGVETIDHGAALLQLGCELAQGYGIARPMPAKEFPNWSAKWKPDASWLKQTMVSNNGQSAIYAAVDHRAWISAVVKYIKGEREMPPQLDSHHCRFGKWLEAEWLDPNSSKLAYADIETVHLRVHALVEYLLELKSKGQHNEALEKVEELYELRDDLLEKLHGLRA